MSKLNRRLFLKPSVSPQGGGLALGVSPRRRSMPRHSPREPVGASSSKAVPPPLPALR